MWSCFIQKLYFKKAVSIADAVADAVNPNCLKTRSASCLSNFPLKVYQFLVVVLKVYLNILLTKLF